MHESPARTYDSLSDPGATVGHMTKRASKGNARNAVKTSEHTTRVDVHNPRQIGAKGARRAWPT